ncbi:hypothetical protein C5B90_19040 [Haloferax sp. Atlit-12N]|uniref:hypothetical protein n=1 Tax=Haloferax sp. Atlit-12N TaxID=2077203 RepID=UPI000E22A16E|nr:hypothetical protein [Haloferax sp. Atlit-12N]RDZ61371.1 hypothetical protein C5B90_19040 [Haloferax sp. Atlit-12N]
MSGTDWTRLAKSAVKVVAVFALGIVLAGVIFAYFQNLVVLALAIIALPIVFVLAKKLFKKYIEGKYVLVVRE